MKKYKIGYTTGVYDMFHIGHLNVIKRAKDQCEYLIDGVTTDELCYKRKKKYPIICEEDRMAIIRELRCVDEVVVQEDMNKLAAVKKYNADAVFVDEDKNIYLTSGMKERFELMKNTYTVKEAQ